MLRVIPGFRISKQPWLWCVRWVDLYIRGTLLYVLKTSYINMFLLLLLFFSFGEA